MASWLARAFGRSEGKKATPSPADNPDLHCSFCGLHRREVRKLVAGPQATICDSCIALCVHILDDESPGGGYPAELMLGHLADRPAHTPHAVVVPRLRAAIELAGGSPELLRRLVVVAIRFEAFATALDALAAIRADQRTSRDALDTAVLLSGEGRHGEALAKLAALDERALAGKDVLLYRLHRALADLEGGERGRVQLAVHRKTAVDLGPEVAALPAGGFDDALRAERLAVLALSMLGLGEHDLAESVARERIALQPGDALARELMARVLEARGDRAGATAARNEALERAHPDGALARRLRAAIAHGGPFR